MRLKNRPPLTISLKTLKKFGTLLAILNLEFVRSKFFKKQFLTNLNNKTMKKLINILAITGLFLVILTSLGWGQIEGDFQTNGNTNFVDATNWQKYNSTLGWVVADHAPTYNDGVITVRNGNIATVTTITTIDQVIVNSGGKIEINSGITLNILNNTLSKNDVSVYGTLKNAGTVNLATSPTATMYFAAGGTYEHNYATSAGTIPSATWEVGSNCLISGYTTCSTPPGGLNQTFGYFTWNCPNQSADINLGNNLATVKGNFRMVSTGTGTNMLTLIDANLVTSSDFDFSITGDLIIQGGILNLASGTVAVGKFVRLNMYSNFLQTGGTFQNSSTSIIYQKFYLNKKLSFLKKILYMNYLVLLIKLVFNIIQIPKFHQ